MKVIIVKQLRKYKTGELKYIEVECATLDDAAKIRSPYCISNPKQGPPYEVIDILPISIRNVVEITHPLDDLPGA